MNCNLYSRCLLEQDDQMTTMDANGPSPSSSTILSLHRLFSESDLEDLISKFFQGLPKVSIRCISILGEVYASWLNNALASKAGICPWIMLSGLNSDCAAPIVVVLPIAPISAENSDDRGEKSHHAADRIAPWFKTFENRWTDLQINKRSYDEWDRGTAEAIYQREFEKNGG